MIASLLKKPLFLASASLLALAALSSVSHAQETVDEGGGVEFVLVDDGTQYVEDPIDWVDDGTVDEGYVDEGYVDEEYVDEGYIDEGYVDEEYVDEGYVDEGCVDEGCVDEGYVDEGYVDDGYVDDGYVDDGNVDDAIGTDVEIYLADEDFKPSDEADFDGSNCGGCEVYAAGGAAADTLDQVDNVTKGSGGHVSTQSSADMCLFAFWRDSWICRVQEGAGAK